MSSQNMYYINYVQIATIELHIVLNIYLAIEKIQKRKSIKIHRKLK